jgi:purine-binding chemotaxis protein CheW
MNIQALVNTIEVQGEYSLEGIDFISQGDQYLVFQLGQEYFAVDILAVREIRRWEQPTKIPNAPNYVKGVINMRGIIVPIIDLRQQFSVGNVVYNKTSVVIVLAHHLTENSKTIGYVVDAVSDVINVNKNEIQPAPLISGSIPQEYISGLINEEKQVITLLNIANLQQLKPHQSKG